MSRMSKMSGDEYMAVLQSRLDEYVAKNPPAPNVQKWAATPLLEWFVRAGDEVCRSSRDAKIDADEIA